MNKNCVIVPVFTTDTLVSSMEIFLVDMGFFSKWWYQYCFDIITVQSYTYPALIHENRNYTLTFLRVDEFDEQS